MDMGGPISRELQLVSFHTVSKGYWGECGQRGAYFEMTNIPPKVCYISTDLFSRTISCNSRVKSVLYSDISMSSRIEL